MAYFDTMNILYFYRGVLLAVVAPACLGSVLRQRWQEPCVGSMVSSQQYSILTSLVLRPSSRVLVTYRLWLAASEMKEAAQSLRNQYLQDRIQSGDLQFHLHSNRTLPGFPNTQPLDDSIPFLDRLSEDFRRVSAVAVFIEQIKRDEEGSMMSPSFLSHFELLEAKIYPFLCLMELAIQSQSGTIRSLSVNRDVMPPDSRHVISAAERFNRDYRILNGSLLLFESIRADYRLLHVRNNRQRRSNA